MNSEKVTVGDLRAALERFPDSARVVIDGYEGGVDDIALPVAVKICIGTGGGVYGCHQVAEPDQTYDPRLGWQNVPGSETFDEEAVHIATHPGHGKP